MKIPITNRFDKSIIIFEYECQNNCIKTTLEEAVRRGVKIMYADLSNLDLSGANLKGATIHAELVNTNLNGACLEGASFISNFSGANLKGANFENASFMGCDFYSANLCCANFKNANFVFSNLSKANFYGAYLQPENFFGNDTDDETNFSATALGNETALTDFKTKQLAYKKFRNENDLM